MAFLSEATKYNSHNCVECLENALKGPLCFLIFLLVGTLRSLIQGEALIKGLAGIFLQI